MTDPKLAPHASKLLLEIALEALTRPTKSDEERDNTVTFLMMWDPASMLTTEDALTLRNAVMKAEEYSGWKRLLVDSINASLRGRVN